MPSLSIRAAWLLAILFFSATAAAQPQAGIPVELRVPRPPALATVRGASYAVFDLHVGNLLDQPLRLLSVRAAAPGAAAPLREYAGAALEANLKAFGVADSASATLLPPGGRAIVYLWIPMRESVDTLAVSVVLAAASGAERTVALAPLPVDPAPPLEIGPPLRGGDWVAANGPDPDSMPGHNRLLVNVGGRIATPQRFATDWVRLGDDGRLWRGAPTSNENSRTWRQEVLAVADGEIVEAVDTLPDNTPPEFVRGDANRLVLRVGEGRYAAYVHLRRGSLRVRAGDRVRRGQVLADVGNSGNSTGPHLHFYLLDAPSGIAGEGIPFVIDRYTLLGVLTGLDDYDERGAAWRPSAPARVRTRELPAGGDVIRF